MCSGRMDPATLVRALSTAVVMASISSAVAIRAGLKHKVLFMPGIDRLVAPMITNHFEVVYVDVGRWNRNLNFAKGFGDPQSKGIPAAVAVGKFGKTIETATALKLAAISETAQGLLAWLQQLRKQP